MSSAAKKTRRAAWRYDRARLARVEADTRSFDRKRALLRALRDRSSGRRVDVFVWALVALDRIVSLDSSQEDLEAAHADMRVARAALRARDRDPLSDRAQRLAGLWGGLDAQRVRAIVATSDVAIERPSLPGEVIWVWDGDSVETYQRVRAARGAR